MSTSSPSPNKREVTTVAVLLDPSTKEEEIIGFAGWIYVTNRRSEILSAQEEEAKKEEEDRRRSEMSVEQRKKEDEAIWGVGANVKFCEDAFIVADEIMYGSCAGGDFCSEFYPPRPSTKPCPLANFACDRAKNISRRS